MTKACFVYCAKRLSDLMIEYPEEQKKEYIIEKTVTLSKTDYENFINDLGVERGYIEENKHLCMIENDTIFHCILIKQKGKRNGVLVMSDGESFPLLVAYKI